jgi:hypothetical protein
MRVNGLKAALLGSLALGTLSTIGDFVWANWITEHGRGVGFTHGAILFLGFGLFLGILAKKPIAGALVGVLIGVAATGSFYLLRPIVGRWMIVLAYVGAWVGLSALNERLRSQRVGTGSAIGRGALAAVASGAAFYLASGVWRPFNPEGWDYVIHFGAWTLAYFPGFAALLVARGQAADTVASRAET